MLKIPDNLFAISENHHDKRAYLYVTANGAPFFQQRRTKKNALRISIYKWQKVIGYYESGGNFFLRCGGTETCSLCQNYFETYRGSCVSCPVSDFSGNVHCINTPYEKYAEIVYEQLLNPENLKKAYGYALDEWQYLVDIFCNNYPGEKI